jgi:hypothetical protein
LITWTDFHVYLGEPPSFRELAVESWASARRNHFKDTTLRDRLGFALAAIRLHHAARWQVLGVRTFGQYLTRYVLPRLAPGYGTVGLGWYLWSTWDAEGLSWPGILIVLSVALIGALAWGIIYWPQPRTDVAFAEEFRHRRMERQRQLLSSEGWQGWRLEQQLDGRYLFVPVAREGSDAPAA